MILDTARRLYNERGLSNVTIRQIAQEMNISSGNLTYHFEKRGDLVKGIFQDLISIESKFLNLLCIRWGISSVIAIYFFWRSRGTNDWS